MRINGTAKCLVRKFAGVWNESNDGTIRTVDLEVARDREQLTAMVGEELAGMVFAAYSESEQIWKLKDPKPTKRVVPEDHKIRVGEHSFTGQPAILKFIPIDETAAVTLRLRLLLGQAQGPLRRELEDSIGCDVDVAFEPSKMELPGMGAA